MGAQIVLDHFFEKYQTLGNTLTDVSFDNISFLKEMEPIYNLKGQKVSKSYYAESKEAIRITYGKIYETYNYNGVDYANVLVGLSKTIHYMDWAGEIAYSKRLQPYYFNLLPVFLGDGSETVAGFSSQKLRKILKEERFAADDYLQAQNPSLYDLLYNRYTDDYNRYLRTGNKTSLVDAMNNETDSAINAVFDNEVFGYEPMTVKELILMNLQ